jgi:hypothetical protein
MEPYPNGQLGFIDDPEHQSGSGSVPTRSRTGSDGPDPLLTLGVTKMSCSQARVGIIEQRCVANEQQLVTTEWDTRSPSMR